VSDSGRCRPYLCPTSGNVECCAEHSGFVVCCDRPELHGPVDCICPPEGVEVPVRWECLLHSGALNEDGSWSDLVLGGDDGGG
jgi:hypothetical protein